MMKYNITNKQIRHGPAARPTLVSRVSTYPYIYIVYSTLRYYELWKFNIYIYKFKLYYREARPSLIARGFLSR